MYLLFSPGTGPTAPDRCTPCRAKHRARQEFSISAKTGSSHGPITLSSSHSRHQGFSQTLVCSVSCRPGMRPGGKADISRNRENNRNSCVAATLTVISDELRWGPVLQAQGPDWLQRLALQELRHLARNPRRLANEHALEHRQAIDHAETEITHGPQHLRPIGEQPVETVGRNAHRHGVEAAPALVALEHGRRIDAEPRGVDDHLRERRHILEAHVEALPGNRVDHMRRITDERDTLGHEGACNRKAKWKRKPRADRADLAEMQAEAPLELSMEFGVGQRDNTISLGGCVGPDDR